MTFIAKEQLVHKGDVIGVALSGGADSVALLNFFVKNKDQFNIKLWAIHIHHGLRDASDQEAAFVKKLCHRLKVPLIIEQVDLSGKIYKGMSIEESARNARYKVFDKFIKEHQALVALGHHMDDQGETVLMNLFRGAGVQGLKGMLPKRGPYIRPLLSQSKASIEAYCTKHQLDYVVDESNKNLDYSRNRIRHEIMPLIRTKLQPKLATQLYKTSQILREEDAYLKEVALEKFYSMMEKRQHKVMLNNEAYLALPDFLQRRVARVALEEARNSLKDISYEHIESMKKLMTGGVTGKCLSLPNHWQVRTDYEVTVIEQSHQEEVNHPYTTINLEEIKDGHKLFKDGFEFRIFENTMRLDYPKNAYTKWFDYDKIGTNLMLRTREPGDWFKYGSKGHRKKLKDYLIDMKVSRPLRDQLQLFAKGQEVIWLVGYRINDTYKVSDTTSKVLEVSFIEEAQK